MTAKESEDKSFTDEVASIYKKYDKFGFFVYVTEDECTGFTTIGMTDESVDNVIRFLFRERTEKEISTRLSEYAKGGRA